MAKLTNEYIQGRIAGNAKVKEARIDPNGDAVIIAADGYGWNCEDMSPATVDIIPASKGAKHFNLSLDRIEAIEAIEAAPVKLTIEELVIEEVEETTEGDAEETEVQDDNA